MERGPEACGQKENRAISDADELLSPLCGFTAHSYHFCLVWIEQVSSALNRPSVEQAWREQSSHLCFWSVMSLFRSLHLFLSFIKSSLPPSSRLSPSHLSISLSFDRPLNSHPVSSALSSSPFVSVFINPSPSIHLHRSLPSLPPSHSLSHLFIHRPLFFLSLLSPPAVTFYIPLNLSCSPHFFLSVCRFHISFPPFLA